MNEERIAKLTSMLRAVASEGGAQERTRMFPNAEVIDASPASLSADYIIVRNDEGFYTPAVKVAGLTVSNGDKVNLLYIKGTEPIAFQHGSGSAGGGGGAFPFTTKVITVDPSGNADHTDLSSALSAASAGDLILFDGTYTITGSVFNLSKVVTLQGISPETSIITSSLTTGTVTVTAAATIRNCKILNTATSGTTVYALDISSSTVLVENVTANRSGSSVTNSYAIQITSGSAVRIKSCTTSASGGSSSTYGVIALGSSSVTVEQGRHDNFSATSSATVVLVDVFLTDPFGGWTGNVTGTIRDAEGRDVGFIVTNSSGATANTGDIGYLDEAGEFQTTTTATDILMVGFGCVVTIGGATTEKIFVKRTGNVLVNYTGSAPAKGDYLVSSTSAGDAQAQTTMHYNIFAVCTAAGSGGQVEVLLHINSATIATNNAADIFRVNTTGNSDFVATINGTPSGTSVVYTGPSSGNEQNLVANNTNQLAKMVLHNTTRGDSALISTNNTGTNTITLTATVPGTWANGDTITIRSQTNTDVISGNVYFIDFQFTSGIEALTRAFGGLNAFVDTGASNINFWMHPYEAGVGSKRYGFNTQVANVFFDAGFNVQPLIEDGKWCCAWEASGSATLTLVFRLNEAILATP